MDIQGKCHCGNISFVYTWPDEETDIPVRVCGCSFCVKHGGAYTSHKDSVLAATVADKDSLERYRFGTATADFFVCRRCGVLPFVTSEIDGNLYAVVNVNVFENIDPSRFSRGATDFDGETTESRLERRQRNWIPIVSVVYSD
jgi:hypothetical protein